MWSIWIFYFITYCPKFFIINQPWNLCHKAALVKSSFLKMNKGSWDLIFQAFTGGQQEAWAKILQPFGE